jgi:DNA-binding XRE family transcriptional regulator
MPVYFVKSESKIYKVSGWRDLEKLTGKTRDRLGRNLAAAIRSTFPRAELAGRFGAGVRGWVDGREEPTHSFSAGNRWAPRVPASVEIIKDNKANGCRKLMMTCQHQTGGVQVTLGSYIKQRRQRLNYTIQDLSNLVDCSRPYLSDIENDKRIPSLKLVNEIAHHLKLESDLLAIKAVKVRMKRHKEQVSNMVKTYRSKCNGRDASTTGQSNDQG